MNGRSFLVIALVAALTLTGAGLGSGTSPAQATQEHPTGACSDPYHLSHAGWDLCWQQEDARVQGIEINQAYFHGDSVVWKMGAPFSLTKYDADRVGPFKDTFGTPGFGEGFGRGAMELTQEDCPRMYDGQAQLLNDNRLCVERRGGPAPELTVWGRYDIFNYRFVQGWTFDDRGHIKPFVGLGGNLIDGNDTGADSHNHHHHIYWRFDFDIGEDGNDVFQQFQRLVGEREAVTFNTAQEATGGLACDLTGPVSLVGWCQSDREALLMREPHVHHKWRVADPVDTNAHGHARSYEFTVHQSDHPPYKFSSFDVLAVQYKGDSQEIGYEVPQNPHKEVGDRDVLGYAVPPESVDDPVVWATLHLYHDTRDEERGSMSYHWAEIDIRPNNFMDENPGEPTFP